MISLPSSTQMGPVERYRLLANAAESVLFLQKNCSWKAAEKRRSKVSFKTYFLKTVKKGLCVLHMTFASLPVKLDKEGRSCAVLYGHCGDSSVK